MLRKKVLYLGTCGSFAPFSKPYLIQAKKVYWMPTGIRTGISHGVMDWHPTLSLETNQKEILPAKTILTSPEISLTDEIKESLDLGSREDLYENMELYAVAEALQQAKELTTIFAVTTRFICLSDFVLEIKVLSQKRKKVYEQWKAYFKEVTAQIKVLIWNDDKTLFTPCIR